MPTNPLSSEVLQELQSKLETKKEHLENELGRFAKQDPNIKGDWDTNYPRTPGGSGSLEEAADEVEEYSTNLHVEFSLETQLKEVNEALERIKKGGYGICRQCGEPIPIERLKAFPEAGTCGKCSS